MARGPAGYWELCTLGIAILIALGSLGTPRHAFGSVGMVQRDCFGGAEGFNAVISSKGETGDQDISTSARSPYLGALSGLKLGPLRWTLRRLTESNVLHRRASALSCQWDLSVCDTVWL